MFPAYRLHGLLGAALLWLLGVTGASAQYLVYELRFTPDEDSVNFSFYTGAYMIAPVQGGAATIVLTTEEGGNRFYAVAEGGGKYFVAANQRVKKAAFSATALRGTAQAFYSASGYLNRSLLLDSPSGARSWRVAEALNGRFMAADDESAVGPAADGSFGMVGSARIKGTLREDLTLNATLSSSTLTEATTYILELLEKYGYTLDAGETTNEQESETADVNAELIDPDSIIDASLFPPEVRGQTPEP
jgi:hypothetical protein